MIKINKKFDKWLYLLPLITLFLAGLLAFNYVNDANPLGVPFLLRHDTYIVLFPFLLGTVTIGGFAVVYRRIQKSKDEKLDSIRKEKADHDKAVQHLQEIYETVLSVFQNIKLQRERLLRESIPTGKNTPRRMRRGIFEEIKAALLAAQLDGERIMKTFDFPHDAFEEKNVPEDESDKQKEVSDKIRAKIKEGLDILQSNIKSQIGGIQGVLNNVIEKALIQNAGVFNFDSQIDVPASFMKFSGQNKKSGNLGFRHIDCQFKAFEKNIRKRIRELEGKSNFG